MVIDREEAWRHTLAQGNAFLDGTSEGAFRVPQMERDQFIERVLQRVGSAQPRRRTRGVRLRSFERLTRLSRQQATRLMRPSFKLISELENTGGADGIVNPI